MNYTDYRAALAHIAAALNILPADDPARPALLAIIANATDWQEVQTVDSLK